MDAVTAYIGLGANIGDRVANLREAVRMIAASPACEVRAVSSLYATRPVGYLEQPDFLNAVIEISTTLTPLELLALCNSIEDDLGRKRTIRWGPRVIDIDILIYGDLVSDNEDLTIPHPRTMERAFVLVPLAEIAPELVLPGGVSARDAAAGIDQGGIEISQDKSWSR